MPQLKTPAFGSPSRMAFSLASSALGGAAPLPPPPLLLAARLARSAARLMPKANVNAIRVTAGLLMGASIDARVGSAKSAAKLTQIPELRRSAATVERANCPTFRRLSTDVEATGPLRSFDALCGAFVHVVHRTAARRRRRWRGCLVRAVVPSPFVLCRPAAVDLGGLVRIGPATLHVGLGIFGVNGSLSRT